MCGVDENTRYIVNGVKGRGLKQAREAVATRLLLRVFTYSVSVNRLETNVKQSIIHVLFSSFVCLWYSRNFFGAFPC